MTLFKPKSITSKVGGQDVEFFSLSFPILFQLKSAVGPISKLVSNRFRSEDNDVARITQGSGDDKIVQSQAISPEMAKVRADLKTKGMQEVIESLFADANRMLIGRILMDSMRSSQPRKPTPEQVNDFLDSIDLGMVIEMLEGVLKANAEVFGPLVRAGASNLSALLRAKGLFASPTSSASASGSSTSSERSVPPVPPGPQLVQKE